MILLFSFFKATCFGCFIDVFDFGTCFAVLLDFPENGQRKPLNVDQFDKTRVYKETTPIKLVTVRLSHIICLAKVKTLHIKNFTEDGRNLKHQFNRRLQGGNLDLLKPFLKILKGSLI